MVWVPSFLCLIPELFFLFCSIFLVSTLNLFFHHHLTPFVWFFVKLFNLFWEHSDNILRLQYFMETSTCHLFFCYAYVMLWLVNFFGERCPSNIIVNTNDTLTVIIYLQGLVLNRCYLCISLSDSPVQCCRTSSVICHSVLVVSRWWRSECLQLGGGRGEWGRH